MNDIEKTGQDAPVVQPASQRPFSQEVGIADGVNPMPVQEVAYVWGNGRTFVDGKKVTGEP